jgi:hypothetical protein
MAPLTIAQFAAINLTLQSQGRILTLNKGTRTGETTQNFRLDHPSGEGSILLSLPNDSVHLSEAIERLVIVDRALQELPNTWTWTRWRTVQHRNAVQGFSISELYIHAGLTSAPDPAPTPAPDPAPTPAPDPAIRVKSKKRAASRIFRGVRLRQQRKKQ